MSVELSNEEHALLLLLGVWGKGIDVKPDQAHVTLLPGGWMKVKSEEARSTLAALQAQLVSSDLRLFQHGGEQFVRLCVAPEHLYFGAELFGYGFSPGGNPRGLVTVKLRLSESLWARGQSFSLDISVPGKMRDSLAAIELGMVGPADLEPFGYSDESMKKNCKEMLDAKTCNLGLRKLVRLSGKNYRICGTRMLG